MSNTTRFGAATLVASLLVLRFLGTVPPAVSALGALIGLVALLAGLLMDRRARQFQLAQPAPNWAEEFTAQVRRDRAAAAAAQEAQLTTGDALAN